MNIYQFDTRVAIGACVAGTAFERHLPLLIELANAILFLHEEGRQLRPLLVISPSRAITIETSEFIDDLIKKDESWRPEFGPGDLHDLAFSPERNLTAGVLLKHLASLSAGPWIPCIELDPLGAILLRRSHLPETTGRRLMENGARRGLVLLMEKIRDGHLRIRINGEQLDVVADPSLHVPELAAGPLEHFMGALQRDRLEQRAPFSHRLTLIFNQVLEHSHGTLYAVAPRAAMDEAFAVLRLRCA